MNNHTHHHNGSIVLKVTATITVIFLVAITLNQIILNRHINDTIEENTIVHVVSVDYEIGAVG